MRHVEKRRLIHIALMGLLPTLALALSLAFAACGGEGGGTPSPAAGGSPTATAAPTASPAAAGTATPSAGETPTPTAPATPVTTEAGMVLEEYRIVPNATRAKPGTVLFRVRNGGTVTHQFVVIKSDLPIAEMPRAEKGGVDETKVDVVDKIEAIAPGEEKTLSLELGAGNYVLICNIVAGGTSHYLSGMYNGFTVEK